jgi:hypothetical protein
MTTKLTVADLAAAFEKKNTGGGGNPTWKLFFPFWKAPVDSTTTIRFLPDADSSNPFRFLVQNFTHELFINGKKNVVACLKMYGEDCPICALSAHYYDKNNPNRSEEMGKKFYRKMSYIGQALVLDSQVEHADPDQLVKLVEFGPQIFKQIDAGFKSGDMDEVPYDYKGGYNFRIRKTVTGGGQNSYSTSNFAPKQQPLADDLIDKIELFNLADYREKKTPRETLEAMLLSASTGAPLENTSAPAEEDGEPVAAPSRVSAPAPVAAPAANTSGMSAVEALRARTLAMAQQNAE